MSLLDTDRALARGSYYAASAGAAPGWPRLQGPVACDVAVVGGGLAGLCAALDLAARGRSVTLLEGGEIGGGASGRNGGQAIHGLACDLSVVEAQLGAQDARRVWDMTIEALDLLQERMAAHAIDAEWQPGYLGVAVSPGKARELHRSTEALARRYGYPMEVIGRAELPRWIDSPRYVAAVHDPRSGHLHPLKLVRGLAQAAARAGVRLHEHARVLAVEPGPRPRLRTAEATVQASQVLLAGNVHLGGLAPSLQSRIMPVGTYITCTEPLDPGLLASLIPSRAAVCDNNFVLDYFRPTADHRLLYGGRVSYSTATPARLQESLRRRLEGTFPRLAGVRLEHTWGGFVDITMNRAPDFGRLPAAGPAEASGASGAAPNVYYLQGFSGHGLALTGLAGRLVAEAMTGDAGRFDVFARLRHHAFPGGARWRRPALVLGMAWYRLRDLLA